MRQLAFLFGFIFCELLEVSGQPFIIKNFGLREGLPQSQVSCLAEDKLGYLWLGTYGGGIARFNGNEFNVINNIDGLPSNSILSLIVDENNKVWIGHLAGISKYERGRLTNYPTEQIQQVEDTGDSILFITRQGKLGKLSKADGKIKFMPIKGFWNQLVKSGDNINAIEISGKIIPLVGERLTTGELDWFAQHAISAKLLLNPGSKVPCFRPDLDFSKFSFLWSEDSVIWLSDNTKLLRYQIGRDGVKIDSSTFTANILSMLRDSEGNIWVATNGKGLFRLNDNFFLKYFDQETIMAVTPYKGGVVAGTLDQGLRYIDNKGELIKITAPLGRGMISGIELAKNQRLWVSTKGGLLNYAEDLTSYTIIKDLPTDTITCIETGQADDIWFGLWNKGVGVLQNGKIKIIDTSMGIGSNYIFDIQKLLDDRMAIATLNGLSLIDQDGKVSNTSVKNTGIPFSSVGQIDSATLLIGTLGSGIYKYNLLNDSFENYSMSDSPLLSNSIYFIVKHNDGIWVGTERGIQLVAPESFTNDADWSSVIYSEAEGFLGIETNLNAVSIGSEVYIGSTDGLYKLKTEGNLKPKKRKLQSKLHLLELRVNGSSDVSHLSATPSLDFGLPIDPAMPFNQNNLTFYFDYISKSSNQIPIYKYQLENFDQEWSAPARNNFVTYNNLPPGKYTLKIQLASDQLSAISYDFVINPPFYKKPLFIGSLIALLIGLIYLVMQWNTNRLIQKALLIEKLRGEEQFKLRKELSRDFHDEMGNYLARLGNYLAIIKADGVKAPIAMIDKAQESVKHLLEGTKEFIWSIDPDNDDLKNLTILTKDFGEKIFCDTKINFRYEYHLKRNYKLPFGFGRNINLIFKEGLTNILKHAHATEVDFSVLEDMHNLIVSLKDNGIGINSSQNNLSRGLQNMTYRSQRIGSTINIHSTSSGSEISLYLPKSIFN